MSNAIDRSKQYEAGLDTQTTQAQVNQTQGEEEIIQDKCKLNVSPIQFTSTVDGQLIPSVQLEEVINATFRPVFRDYVGCNIVYTTVNLPVPNAVGPNGFVAYNQNKPMGFTTIPRFEVNLYFQTGANAGRCAEGAISNVRPFASKAASSMAARIEAINKRSILGKNLTLTDDTKDMLDEFFLAPYRENATVVDPTDPDRKRKIHANVPKWDKGLIYEVTDGGTVMGNFNTLYLKVTNLDLIAILKKIYGSKNELGHQVDYEVRGIKPISYSPNPAESTLLLMINRLDCSNVAELSRSLGMMTMINGLPINRG